MNFNATRTKSLLAALTALVLAACGPLPAGMDDGGMTGAGGGGAMGTADGGAPSRNWSCLQILQAAIQCPDDACADLALANGTPEGQTNVIALATCIQAQACEDSACIETSCGAELNTCVDSSGPITGGTPLTGTAPNGSVPADLVGNWSGARDGITYTVSFNADGSGSMMSAITWQQYACLSFKTTTRTGNFVVQEPGNNAYGLMTLYATDVQTASRECVPPEVRTNEGARKEEFLWSRPDDLTDTRTIFIVDMECAKPYLAQPGWQECRTYGCPIGLYCTSRLTRQ
jgi:hypothetical protein